MSENKTYGWGDEIQMTTTQPLQKELDAALERERVFLEIHRWLESKGIIDYDN